MIIVDDYNRIEIYITDLWREWYIPKFRMYMEVSEPYLSIYWTDGELGNSNPRKLVIDYNDVSGYGYANPSSAADLESIITGYINSAWTDIGPGGNILNAKADLLSNDGASDTILPGGANEYILSRDNAETTGLKWISKNAVGTGIWQPLDSDLTDIAGLSATTDNFIQAKSGAWSSRTIAQVKTDLGIPDTLFSKSSADQSTASVALADITNVGLSIAANQNIYFKAIVKVGASGTNGARYAITIPTGATMLVYHAGMNAATISLAAPQWLTTSGTEGTTINIFAVATMLAMFEGWVYNGSNAGTIQVQGRSANVANTVTWYSGSNILGHIIT